jgi:hypothetical protein
MLIPAEMLQCAASNDPSIVWFAYSTILLSPIRAYHVIESKLVYRLNHSVD